MSLHVPPSALPEAGSRRAAVVPELREPWAGLSRPRVAQRLALAVPSLATILALGWLAAVAFPAHDALSWAVLATFCAVMGWQAFTAWQYIYGSVAAALGRRAKSALERASEAPSALPRGEGRTAAIVPIYAEDAVAVFARLRVMARSLAREGADDIDIFVLSDTRDGATAAVEEHEFARIRAWAAGDPALPRIRYRRRVQNLGRKAGNVAEFCETYGHEYEFMIVLDADSLMTGAAMIRLVRLMQASPRVGLIQTVSYAAGRDTLFARVQQFAVRLYAPLALRCLETWQGPHGSYWGHNAILRIAAFAAHAGLPVLPGRAPLGGEILCHDIVEGALMVRAGWEVRLLPEMGGTWEEMPTNLIDLLGRERRWCQGNLQHLRVLPWAGLAGASRWHLGVGILSYVMLPLWIAFLGLAAWQAVRGGDLGLLAYGLTGTGAAAHVLAGLSIVVLAAPKLLSLLHVLVSRERRTAFGGAGRLLISAVLEQLVWVFLWPVMTLFTASAVAATFMGRVVRWETQDRDDRQVSWAEAFRLQADAVVVGALMALGLAWAGNVWLALWLMPVALALLTSPAQSVLTSRPDLGRWARARGLFLTVDDTAQAPELAELAQMRGTPALAARTLHREPAVWLPATDEA
jgi:membrane glycosyltransferase